MEFIIAIGVFFSIAIGLMFAVSSDGHNPTPRQIKNRIVMQRRIKKLKKMLKVDDVIAPFIAGLILIFFLVVFTFKLHGVI